MDFDLRLPLFISAAKKPGVPGFLFFMLHICVERGIVLPDE